MISSCSYNNINFSVNFGARIGKPRNLNAQVTKAIIDGSISQHFVPTPDNVINLMIKELGAIKSSDKILEPSAGYGHIADKLVQQSGLTPNKIDVIEPVTSLRQILHAKGFNLVGYDILEYSPKEKYDKIIMNPPFDKGSEILHLLHCFSLLKPKGKLVAILPENDFLPIRQPGYEKWMKDWLSNGKICEINEYLADLLKSTESKTYKLGNVFTESDVPDDVLTRLVVITK